MNLNNIETLLGDAASNYSEGQKSLCRQMAETEVKNYTKRTILDEELNLIVDRIAVIKLFRLATEGIASHSFSGINESFIDGYPADIVYLLNNKRKIKIL